MTRHIDIEQGFLRELKRSKQLIVRWISGSTNNANMFTKTAEMLLEDGALDMHKTLIPKSGGCPVGLLRILNVFNLFWVF
jgi:hypothetical protein